MYPTLSDFTSRKSINFDLLRNQVVIGPSYAPSFGLHKDLQQQIDMLEREFVGQNRLKLAHAVLNVLLRRRIETDVVYQHFCRLWCDHSDILLETLDSRWLVSACDTISDFSDDAEEAQIASLLSLFINTLKLTETERTMSGLPRASPEKLKGRIPLFDGLTAFVAGSGDMPSNLLQRLDRVLKNDALVSKIGREMVNRVLSSETVYSRFAKLQSRNRWLPYLDPVPEPSKARAEETSSIRARSSDKATYILLNDTSRLGGGFHFGTVFACNSIRQSLERRGLVELGWANDRQQFDNVLKVSASKPSLVVLNGEGSLHHGAPRALELLSICVHSKDLGIPVAVINSVWEENPDEMSESLRSADIVHVRDSRSLAALPPKFSAEVTPDVSINLFLKAVQAGEYPTGKNKISVMDSVVPATSTLLLDFSENQNLPFFVMPGANLKRLRDQVAKRSGPVRPKLLQLPDVFSAHGWVTGRFHGLIAALCAGIPVCGLSSNTAKIEGLLSDLGLIDECLLNQEWFLLSADEKRLALEDRFRIQEGIEFVERRDSGLKEASVKIDRMFDDVARLAASKKKNRWFSWGLGRKG